jgi:hypothetical protein
MNESRDCQHGRQINHCPECDVSELLAENMMLRARNQRLETRNERLARAIEAMPFGDTAASFAIYVRNFE